ncbi:MAG: global cell cycle regulator GcrA-like protein [Alphaproteobacteria bacterium]|nr:MAG: global cell cycle regulator GcrA-like protein [Alphaproteobacteria bacterium]
MGKTTWTDERVEQLKTLWGAGKTAAEIAKDLGEGLTRNAVIGKAHRLGLSGRVTPIQKKIDKPLPPESKDLLAKNGGISLLELTEKTCRYPYGDPQKSGFHFCGGDAIPGVPYCGQHAEVSYQRSARKFTINENTDFDTNKEGDALAELDDAVSV